MHVPTPYFLLSLPPTLLGFGLVVWTDVSPVRNPQEFRLWRMFMLLGGNLLTTSPLLLLSWSLLDTSPHLAGTYFLASMILSFCLPILFCGFSIGWVAPGASCKAVTLIALGFRPHRAHPVPCHG